MPENVTRSLALTDSAMTRILSVMENNEDIGSKFRVYVTGGGCSGFQYGFKFDSEIAFEILCLIHIYMARLLILLRTYLAQSLLLKIQMLKRHADVENLLRFRLKNNTLILICQICKSSSFNKL